MKKILYLIICAVALFLLPGYLRAQPEPVVHWSKPAVFIPSEKVSFFFDVKNTKLEKETKLFIHSWFPSSQTERPANELALVHVEGTVWRFDMTPTEFYKMSEQDIRNAGSFYGLLRNEDWSKGDVFFAPDIESSQISVYNLQEIKEGDINLDFYPKKFTQDKPVSFLINAKKTWSNNNTETCVQGELNNSTQVVVHSGVNDWAIVQPSNQEKAKLTKIDDGIWRMDLILKDYYELPEDYDLHSINMVFASENWQWQGKDAGCNDFKVFAPDIPVPPSPVLSFFPLKISIKDLLVITRDNNDRGQRLSYTITGGSKTATGELAGNKARQRAYINLSKEFNGEKPSKLSVLIKDHNDREIYKGDLPLVTVDNPAK